MGRPLCLPWPWRDRRRRLRVQAGRALPAVTAPCGGDPGSMARAAGPYTSGSRAAFSRLDCNVGTQVGRALSCLTASCACNPSPSLVKRGCRCRPCLCPGSYPVGFVRAHASARSLPPPTIIHHAPCAAGPHRGQRVRVLDTGVDAQVRFSGITLAAVRVGRSSTPECLRHLDVTAMREHKPTIVGRSVPAHPPHHLE